jgi:arsenate reductase (thioredoxin)
MKTELFLCMGNTARSRQMAEGGVNARFGDEWRAASAGVEPKGLAPEAVLAMAEFEGRGSNLGVTLCDDAMARCPIWPGAAHRLHLLFEDPGQARAAGGGEAEVLAVLRRVRDEMLWRRPEALRQDERTVPP